MFSLFKRKEAHPISKLFAGISTDQKYSILNFLHTITSIDGLPPKKRDAMFVGMNFYVDVLNVKAKDAMNYYKQYGITRLVSDLKQLNRELKEVLVLMGHGFITIDERPTEIELVFMSNFFDEIGITEEQYIIIVKNSAIINDFMK